MAISMKIGQVPRSNFDCPGLFDFLHSIVFFFPGYQPSDWSVPWENCDVADVPDRAGRQSVGAQRPSVPPALPQPPDSLPQGPHRHQEDQPPKLEGKSNLGPLAKLAHAHTALPSFRLRRLTLPSQWSWAQLRCPRNWTESLTRRARRLKMDTNWLSCLTELPVLLGKCFFFFVFFLFLWRC